MVSTGTGRDHRFLDPERSEEAIDFTKMRDVFYGSKGIAPISTE